MTLLSTDHWKPAVGSKVGEEMTTVNHTDNSVNYNSLTFIQYELLWPGKGNEKKVNIQKNRSMQFHIEQFCYDYTEKKPTFSILLFKARIINFPTWCRVYILHLRALKC